MDRDKVIGAIENMLAGETTTERIGSSVFVWFWLDGCYVKAEITLASFVIEKRSERK